jgi:tetratricopeptide (TPR) repeat protein
LECRNLLRDFETPDRLRRNSLAAPVFALAGKSADRRFLLWNVISDVLTRLTPRGRAIVQRCDINKEPFRSVARDLDISERHLYRERRRVLGWVAHLIREYSSDAVQAQLSTTTLEAQLRTSRVLVENGALETAAEVIERLIGQSPETEKCRLLLCLAELHCRSGFFARALDYLENAGTIARQAGFGDGMLAAELLLTRASIFEECGQGQLVVAKSAATAARLAYAANTYRYDDRAAKLLISALVLCGKSYAARGDMNELERTSVEASDLFGTMQRPDDESQIDLLFLRGLSEGLCHSDHEKARAYLSQATNLARGAGFTLTAIQCATNMASIYRLERKPRAAVAMLEDVLLIARRMGNPSVLLAVLVELASSHAELEGYEQAQSLLVEAATLRTENESLRASMLRTSAHVNVATKQFASALDDARSAHQRFAALGKERLIGKPLRLEAQALLGLGERTAALRAISSAIDVQSAKNTKSALDDAYAVLGEITGRRRGGSIAEPARRLTPKK